MSLMIITFACKTTSQMGEYTTPRLNKGKVPKSIPKGSSKQKELAKNVWYVSYTYGGKQFKVKSDINRCKDHVEKELQGEILLESIKKDLKEGFNPLNQLQWTEKIRRDTLTLDEAIVEFNLYHNTHNSRKKTIQTYLSKIKALSAHYPGVLIGDINTRQLQSFIQSKIDDKTYSQNSVKSAKRIFSAFFNVCIQLDFIKSNPMQGFDKKIKSHKLNKERHVPISDEDLKTIFKYLDSNDSYCAFFCRMIYYTCLRPAEIRGLKIENIDLNNNTITIPADVKKVTTTSEKDLLEINMSFKPLLKKLKLNQYPKNYYLTGSTENIIGETRIGENTPYHRFVNALKKLELNNKGYDLYSFKHTSNIKKYKKGWTLAEIMKANRHTSISTTEIYLKKLGLFIDTKDKSIPKI